MKGKLINILVRGTRRGEDKQNELIPLATSQLPVNAIIPSLILIPSHSRHVVSGCCSSMSMIRLVHSTSIGVNSSGMKVDRPISPHVTIYSQPLPAISSITNRVTGSILSAGVIGIGLLGLFVHCDLTSHIANLQTSMPLIIPLMKLSIAFPFIYHYLAGLRHIYWDRTAQGLELASVELSSQVLIGTSILLALIATFITIQPNNNKQKIEKE